MAKENKSNNHEEFKDTNNCEDESIEDLRARLNAMKQLMTERQNTTSDILNGQPPLSLRGCGIIDSSLLSFIFMGALIVIMTVSIYAFYTLYQAIFKKFAPHHDEL